MNSALPKNTEDVKEHIALFERNELRKIFYDIAEDYRKKYREDKEKNSLIKARLKL